MNLDSLWKGFGIALRHSENLRILRAHFGITLGKL